MQPVRVRDRGQITIPNKLRERFNIESNTVIYADAVDEGIILRPKETLIEQAQAIGEKMLREKGLTVKDLLRELDESEE